MQIAAPLTGGERANAAQGNPSMLSMRLSVGIRLRVLLPQSAWHPVSPADMTADGIFEIERN